MGGLVNVRRPGDFWAGLVFVFFGVSAMILSWGYQIGKAAKMGPGYFPFALGGILAVLGFVIAAKSLSKEKPMTKSLPVPWRPLIVVLCSVLLFGLLLPHVGFVVSVFGLVFLSSTASHEFRAKEAFLNAVVLLLLVLLVFVYLLQTQVPLWPTFTGRGT